jgi:putative DNA methylase
MFASYKGEGTGAVRHMFSHHILKPERMPIEANLWGTPRSSGAFSTLFKSRLLRALDYREAPFEVAVKISKGKKTGQKVFGISPPMGREFVEKYPKGGLKPGDIYLSCGSSAHTDLPDGSVDLVVTDPPFFDNVHYSELADFFFVWQETGRRNENAGHVWTTRHREEVQDVDPKAFAQKLRKVFEECLRVLKEDGLLVFSYHHSREEGWSSLASAVSGAGFSFVQSQPVKSEMSVAAPKGQTEDPIDLDVLLVCRKRTSDGRRRSGAAEALGTSTDLASSKIRRFNQTGRRLSKNDVRIVLLSQLLVELSAGRPSAAEIEKELDALLPRTRPLLEALWTRQDVSPTAESTDANPLQLRLEDLLVRGSS